MLKLEKKEQSMELLEKVLEDKNLYRAYEQVYKNKGVSGIDGMTVEKVGYFLYKHKEETKEQIINVIIETDKNVNVKI